LVISDGVRSGFLPFLRTTGNTGEDGILRLRIELDRLAGGDSGARTHRILCGRHGAHELGLDSLLSSSAGFRTPDWAKGVVWYQIFPERFRNGNPANDPGNWDLTPLGWDEPFAEPSIEEIERAWNRRLAAPERFSYRTHGDGGAAAGVVYAKRYGGDLMGVYEKMDEIKAMGATGIYLCPVFVSRSLHKYDTSDHRHIDPTLGHPGVYDDPGPGHQRLAGDENPSDETTWAWTPADRWFVDAFLGRARALGLRVIIDGVWNHVGTDHFAFRDVAERGVDSVFADWFEVVFDDNGELLGWQGWSRINGDLPEFKQEGGDLAPGPKAHVMAVTRRWMDPNGDGDPNDGIDGWRLDVAGEIGERFWADWRREVKSLNPEALIIAEIWHDAGEMLSDKAFDGQMNYPLAYAVADWLSIGEVRGDASVAAVRLNRVFDHGPQADLVQMNLMTSHDTERLASLMHNDSVRGYDNGARRWERGTRYNPQTVEREDMERALCAFGALVAAPGSLMIYNGDEYALPGADDPDNRRPIPWGMIESLDAESPRAAFHDQVAAMMRLRVDPDWGPVLRYGVARFEAGEEGALIVRRALHDRMIETALTPPGTTGGATQAEGWREVDESSRKFGMGERMSVEMRFFRAMDR